MRRLGLFLTVCSITVILLSSGALAAQKWALGCSGAGSGPYVWGGTIANLINKHQQALQISPQATAGYNENVELVSLGKMEIAQQTGSGYVDSYKGEEAFKGRAHTRLRLLFTFNLAPFHVVTREAAGIKTVADLKGKKMNIALPAQTTRTFDEAFLEAAGIKQSEIKVFEMATGQTFPALQDGVIDATGNLYSAGHGRLLELATNTRIRLLDLPEDLIERFLKLRPAAIKFTIPPNTYKGQDYPVHTIAATSVLFVRDDLSEDLVYQFTKTFWDNLGELKKDPGFKVMKLEYAYSKTMGCPYHPGALKYLKEKGLVK